MLVDDQVEEAAHRGVLRGFERSANRRDLSILLAYHVARPQVLGCSLRLAGGLRKSRCPGAVAGGSRDGVGVVALARGASVAPALLRKFPREDHFRSRLVAGHESSLQGPAWTPHKSC